MIPVATLPPLSIEIDGAPLRTEDARCLTEVRVQQRLSLPTLCELTFADGAGAGPGPGPAFAPGAALRVAVRGHDEELFAGELTALEYAYDSAGGRLLRARGYDRLHRLQKRQPVRAHVQVTLADLARELVADLGVAVEAVEAGPLWHRVIQHRESDLDLLLELGERCGLYFTLRGSVLHLLTLQGIGEPVPLGLGDALLEARIEVNTHAACRTVSAAGWDPWRGELHEGRAGSARVGRRVAAEAPADRVGGTGERNLVGEAVQDDRQADALAQAELDLRSAAEVTLWGVADGDPRLRPGTPVTVRGVADPVAGRYVLTAVDHTIDDRKGFVSEISTAPPAPRPRAAGALATLGTVARVDDPDRLGRVQVSLPAYGNVESDWMGVLMAGAGAGKGLVTLPDVGDLVLVLLARSDPAQGVVLGGLYGAGGPPDGGVEGGAVRRYTFLSPGGQRVRLDDARRLLRLENSDGSYLELSPEVVMLHAAAALTIEAPGQPVVIRGTAIDFQRA